MGLLVKKARLAEILNVSTQTIDDWRKDGLLITQGQGSAGLYDVGEVFHWRIGRTAEGAENPRTKLSRVNAEFRELELAEARGKVVGRENVVEVWAAAVGAMRARLLGLSRRAAPKLANEPAERAKVAAVLDALVDEALREISSNEFAEGIPGEFDSGPSGGGTPTAIVRKPVGRPRKTVK